MIRPILAVDIDEVMFPWMPSMMRYHNARYGTQAAPQDVAHLGIDFARLWDCTYEESVERIHEFCSLDHRSIDPIEETKGSLEILHEHYDIVVATSRDPMFRVGTQDWLDHHIPGLYDHLVITGNRYTGRPFYSKVEVCLDLGVKALVDDQLHYAEEASRLGLPCLLFGDYAWNQVPGDLPSGVQRVLNWTEATRVLLDMVM